MAVFEGAVIRLGLPTGWEVPSWIVGAALAALLLWAAGVSWGEGERRAASRFCVGGLFCLLLFGGLPLLPGPWGPRSGAVATGAVIVVALLFLLPLSGGDGEDLGTPLPGVDERDIMFSRAELAPGSSRYRDYYASHPEKKELDDTFRREPGLLDPGSTHFHGHGFAAADAAFWTIERLRPFVEGKGGRSPVLEGEDSRSPDPGPGGDQGRRADPGSASAFLKGWALKLGAHSVGLTVLRDYHLYSHAGRGSAYGDPVDLGHSHALALTVEMDREMVGAAPRSPTVMESARQYLRSGVMAIQLADLIRRLGHRARAHVDGNYRVICPLVARDAGLGEIGRMGLLMTPGLGPRVRIAVVTTDLPLDPDPPTRDLTVLDFCAHCRKCAVACPSQAISVTGPEEDSRGVRRWRIDSEACFTLWTRLGTDCARCMAVCPYSHPDNLLHDNVRWWIRHNVVFRRWAARMDDLLYGSRPIPRALPEWMRGKEN